MAEEPVMSLFDHVQVKEEFAAKLFDLVQGASDADEPGPMEVARLLFAEAGALMSACAWARRRPAGG